MEFLKNFQFTWTNIAKALAIFVSVIIVISIVASLLSSSFRSISNGIVSTQPYMDERAVSYSKDMVGYPSPVQSQYNYIAGNTAENYEVKSYNASFRTRELENVCDEIETLKKREDVIFTSTNRGKEDCHYEFKVKNEVAEKILFLIKDLEPEFLNAEIHTIQKQITDSQTEIDILNKKLDSIETNLMEAISSYSELTDLAKKKNDIDSLTKLVDLKTNTINKLTDERMNLREQIQRITVNQNEQLDRIKYTYFTINASLEKIFDSKEIFESWKNQIRQFFSDINNTIQAPTIGLMRNLLYGVQAFVYIVLAGLFLKLLWTVGKRLIKN